MGYRFCLVVTAAFLCTYVSAQRRNQTILISKNGEISEVQTVLLKKYKGNVYEGLPQLINDTIKIIGPSTIDFAIIGSDTLFSLSKIYSRDIVSLDQFVRKVHAGNKLEMLATKLTDYGYFYLIRKRHIEKSFRLLIDEPRIFNPVVKAYGNGAPGYIQTTILKEYRGIEVLSPQSENAYANFVMDYFSDCVLLRNKFKSEFYTSKDFLTAVKEYERCK